MAEEVQEWKQHKKSFKRNHSDMVDLLDEFDQKKDLESRLPHTKKAEAKMGELENDKRSMEAIYQIMDNSDQQACRPKRQELNK